MSKNNNILGLELCGFCWEICIPFYILFKLSLEEAILAANFRNFGSFEVSGVLWHYRNQWRSQVGRGVNFKLVMIKSSQPVYSRRFVAKFV